MSEARWDLARIWEDWAQTQDKTYQEVLDRRKGGVDLSTLRLPDEWLPIDDLRSEVSAGLWDSTPRIDPWGTPYQFQHVKGGLAVRSAGKDRSFEQGEYREGGFPFDDTEADLVFVSGKWLRWPVFPKSDD